MIEEFLAVNILSYHHRRHKKHVLGQLNWVCIITISFARLIVTLTLDPHTSLRSSPFPRCAPSETWLALFQPSAPHECLFISPVVINLNMVGENSVNPHYFFFVYCFHTFLGTNVPRRPKAGVSSLFLGGGGQMATTINVGWSAGQTWKNHNKLCT